MKDLLAAGALGVVASCLLSAPASASPPESAAGAFEISYCGFPVQFRVTGKSKVIEHGDQLITIGPAQKGTFINTAAGKSVSLNLSGTFHETVLADGDLVGKATGHNLFAGPGVEGLLYTTGKVSYRVDAASGSLTITEPSAKTVNVCDLLT